MTGDIYQRINEHETGKHHNQCVDIHILNLKHNGTENLLFYLKQSRRLEIKNNRLIMERVIDVIKLIGKRGLSYRGKDAEAAYSLDDPHIDHGNFLELIILLSKYEPLLKRHLDKVIRCSKDAHLSGSKGRGNLINNIVYFKNNGKLYN